MSSMNYETYGRFELLTRLASTEPDDEKYYAMVDELNAILLRVIQDSGTVSP